MPKITISVLATMNELATSDTSVPVDHALDAAHVVLQPRQDLARARVGEEAQRLAPAGARTSVAQVEHHPLTHHRHQVVLPALPISPVTSGIAIMPATSQFSSTPAVRGDGVVDDPSDEQRRDQPSSAETAMHSRIEQRHAPLGREAAPGCARQSSALQLDVLGGVVVVEVEVAHGALPFTCPASFRFAALSSNSGGPEACREGRSSILGLPTRPFSPRAPL